MEYSLFSDVGNKLKKYATAIFVIEVVLSIILAFVFGIEEYYESEFKFHPIIFFSILLAGIGYSYISSLAIYGFGQLIDDVHQAKSNSHEIARRIAKSDSTENLSQKGSSKPLEQDSGYFSRLNTENKTEEKGKASEHWICKKCGTRNLPSSRSCRDCGEYK